MTLLRQLRLAQRLNTTIPTPNPLSNRIATQHFSIFRPSQTPILRTNTGTLRLEQRRSFTTLRNVRKWYQSLWQPRSHVEAPYAHITQIGDPMLRQPAQLVPTEAIQSREVQFLVDKLVAVMRDYRCVGLAAPQIGTPLQVLVMEFTSEQLASFSGDVQRAKRMAVIPLTVLINPKLHVTNFDRTTFAESCESVRGYRADVTRYTDITVTGYTTGGVLQRLSLHGWNARIAQHEIDHLNGVLYTDVMDVRSLTCTCWQAVNAREGRVYIEFAPKS